LCEWQSNGNQVNREAKGAALDRFEASQSRVPGSRIPEPLASSVMAPSAPGDRHFLVQVVEPAAGRSDSQPVFYFAGFRLEADGTLLHGDAVVHLPPKELAALRVLLANPGQIVSPVQLRQAIWGDVHVTADSVPKCVSSLRARLGPDDCVQTVYKRGYRLTAEVLAHGVALAGALPRLAIPPFATEYSIPDYLGSAVAEETITRLSNDTDPAVTVLARDSVFTLARQRLTAQQIGEALNADLVLTGTIRAVPAHFRLRAEMIRVMDGAQIWAEDLLVDRNRVAGIECELIERLAFRLVSTAHIARGRHKAVPPSPNSSRDLSPRKRQPDGLSIAAVAEPFADIKGRTSSREAYEIYQQGRHEWQSLQRHRMQDGLQHLHRATELDPALTAAKVDLVHLCITQSFYGFMAPNVAADTVRRTADSVLPATGSSHWGDGSAAWATGVHGSPNLPEFTLPHLSEAILPALAWVNFHVDRDLPAALRGFARSAHLPHDPWTTRARSMFSLSRYRFAEAIELLRAALHQDPFAPWLHARLAWAFHLAGQPEDSVRQVNHALALFPEHEGAVLYGAMILAFNGEPGRAAELAHTLVKLSPYFDLPSAVHAYALACDGRNAEARTILDRLQWMSRERFVLNTFNAAVYVALGDLDAAIAELQSANEIRCPWFFQVLADPRLRPLHGHPAFIEMQSILPRMEAAAQAVELEA
jgi:DNA-binding winged helix-turn-helix (wHTH) protein/tetratricopeptide (TPR) repeat protein